METLEELSRNKNQSNNVHSDDLELRARLKILEESALQSIHFEDQHGDDDGLEQDNDDHEHGDYRHELGDDGP